MGNEQFDGFDRVSSILDVYKEEQLIDWYIKNGKREARRLSKIATDIGTAVDEYIKAEILREKLPKLKNVEVENCVKAWNKFKNDFNYDERSFKVGARLFDDKTMITGEPDLLIIDKQEVIDIKCSGKIRDKYWIQTEWYARQLGFKTKSILRLSKDLGVYEYESRELCDKDIEVFDALTTVYRYFKSEKEEVEE